MAAEIPDIVKAAASEYLQRGATLRFIKESFTIEFYLVVFPDDAINGFPVVFASQGGRVKELDAAESMHIVSLMTKE